MASDHTQGPWKLESASRDPEGSDLIVTSHDGADTIADCRAPDTGVADVAEAEANARLIAAAPELLASLRTLLEAHDEDGVPRYSEIAAARAAIAKAEGR